MYPSLLDAFNTEALKASSMGVTIMASSGDEGVSNSMCDAPSGSSASSWAGNGSWTGYGYFPNFPASSPYVVAG